MLPSFPIGVSVQGILRVASCWGCRAPTVHVSVVVLSDTLVIRWRLWLVNIHIHNSIFNVHNTVSSILFEHCCLIADGTSGLSSSVRYWSRKSCSLALSSRFRNALSARTLKLSANYSQLLPRQYPHVWNSAMYTSWWLSGSKCYRRVAAALRLGLVGELSPCFVCFSS